MAIKIEQTCDGCGAHRELHVRPLDGVHDIKEAADRDGWRELYQNRHLCAQCIRNIFK